MYVSFCLYLPCILDSPKYYTDSSNILPYLTVIHIVFGSDIYYFVGLRSCLATIQNITCMLVWNRKGSSLAMYLDSFVRNTLVHW